MAEPYQLPIATVLDVCLSFGVATTTVELDQESYLGYPIAPASLWALDSDVSVFDFHQLIQRDDRRLIFESYEVQAVPLPVGAKFRFCSWWTPQAIAAVRDLAAKWELRPYPGNDHSHCLLTWARISATDEETEGYYNSEHGWITKAAFRECFDEDRLHIRRAWQSIE